MKIDGVSAVGVVMIASFALDRAITALLYCLSFVKPWARLVPDPAGAKRGPERTEAERRQKLAYILLAGVLGMGVIAGYGNIRMLRAVGFTATKPWLDVVITGIMLMAGSDSIGKLLKKAETAGSKFGSEPVEITGTLTLEGEDTKAVVHAQTAEKEATGAHE